LIKPFKKQERGEEEWKGVEDWFDRFKADGKSNLQS